MRIYIIFMGGVSIEKVERRLQILLQNFVTTWTKFGEGGGGLLICHF